MKKKVLTVLIVAALLSGFSLLLYPTVSDYMNRVSRAKDISGYVETVANIEDKDYKSIWDSAVKYNERLASKPAHWRLNEQETADYESQLNIFGQGVMAYVEIPKIGCSLPIYHGTGVDVLQIAIGHLEGTSLPTGGKSTHCVVSGHRGLPSAKLFTGLDKLTEGDTFSVRTLDETLTYEVDRISIVLPTETQKLQIVPGEDLFTLMTCTPYGVNTHRLLVRGHRIENSAGEEIRVTADALQIDPVLAATFLAVPAALILMLTVLILIIRRR